MSAPEQHTSPAGGDVSLRGALIFGAALLSLVALSLVLMKWTLDFFADQESRGQVPPASLLRSQETPTRPSPAFLMYPARHLQEFRAAEDAVLESYGWVDRSAGVARIPIERAMEMILEQGLPARSGAGAAAGDAP